MIDRQNAEVDKVTDRLDSAWTKELDSPKGNRDWKYTVATAITRVGVVLIIVYLVQILLNFYRYNSRLITYYYSRRYLLLLWDGKKRDLEHLEKALAASKIDFGKEPKHPLEDIIKALGEKARETTMRPKRGLDLSKSMAD